MSYGFDFKERQRRNRRQDTRILFSILRSVITTAALVAIACAFDVPEKLRQKFWGIPAEVARPQPQAEPKHSEPPRVSEPLPREGAPREPLESIPRRPPRWQSDPLENHRLDGKQPDASRKDELVVPERPPSTELPPLDNLHASAPETEEPQGQFLVLDLNKKQVRIPIADAPGAGEPLPRVRVIGLRVAKIKVELEPADGEIVDEVQILFSDHPRARILVRTDKVGPRMVLVVEPQLALWAEEPISFTLKKVKGEAYQARRAAAEFHATLAVDKERKSDLQIWLNNARGIPLDEHKQGKLQFAALEHSIEEREGKVELVKQGVAELDALEQLAVSLHDRAELRFEVVDGH